MDQDTVRISLVLGPADDVRHTYTQPMPRWVARDALRDFAHGVQWDERPVLRALIVP